ncbi:hypothetical protein DOTSEDRAFT_32206 [Dothistroma septosporum NZE10]|uniref:Uncharacterized protein n=1 Tax=Dothistroma septosporum (strain NZE10 / CBS 128990) TaxID=675120 RepID=N1PWN9_DOTSN|nr:hypothetical protein DOTSEDRAFT_32206 [Dothistroma septosporum NZE10]
MQSRGTLQRKHTRHSSARKQAAKLAWTIECLLLDDDVDDDDDADGGALASSHLGPSEPNVISTTTRFSFKLKQMSALVSPTFDREEQTPSAASTFLPNAIHPAILATTPGGGGGGSVSSTSSVLRRLLRLLYNRDNHASPHERTGLSGFDHSSNKHKAGQPLPQNMQPTCFSVWRSRKLTCICSAVIGSICRPLAMPTGCHLCHSEFRPLCTREPDSAAAAAATAAAEICAQALSIETVGLRFITTTSKAIPTRRPSSRMLEYPSLGHVRTTAQECHLPTRSLLAASKQRERLTLTSRLRSATETWL